jgi:hypothetical protein
VSAGAAAQPPGAVAEQGQDCREQDAADDRGVDEDGGAQCCIVASLG